MTQVFQGVHIERFHCTVYVCMDVCTIKRKMFCLYSFGIHTHHCNHEDKQSGLYGETFLRRGKIRALNNEGEV